MHNQYLFSFCYTQEFPHSLKIYVALRKGQTYDYYSAISYPFIVFFIALFCALVYSTVSTLLLCTSCHSLLPYPRSLITFVFYKDLPYRFRRHIVLWRSFTFKKCLENIFVTFQVWNKLHCISLKVSLMSWSCLRILPGQQVAVLSTQTGSQEVCSIA